MQSHDQLVKKLLARPGVRAEVDRLEREESTILDALLKALKYAVKHDLCGHLPCLALLDTGSSPKPTD